MENKEKIYLTIITILFVLFIWQFIPQFIPIYRFIEIPDDKVCIEWSKPIPNSDGNGNWRYCKKAVDYTDEFNRACYWNYDCTVYSEWRGDYLGIPSSCLTNNIDYSYWGNDTTSRFYEP